MLYRVGEKFGTQKVLLSVPLPTFAGLGRLLCSGPLNRVPAGSVTQSVGSYGIVGPLPAAEIVIRGGIELDQDGQQLGLDDRRLAGGLGALPGADVLGRRQRLALGQFLRGRGEAGGPLGLAGASPRAFLALAPTCPSSVSFWATAGATLLK